MSGPSREIDLRVLCLIDYLASGGAQRQICTLAVLLKKLGMDVSMLTYHHHDFFLPMLQSAGIPHTCLEDRTIPARALTLRRALRRGRQDVVLAFMLQPNIYAELAAFPWRRWGLVVSGAAGGPEGPEGVAPLGARAAPRGRLRGCQLAQQPPDHRAIERPSGVAAGDDLQRGGPGCVRLRAAAGLRRRTAAADCRRRQLRRPQEPGAVRPRRRLGPGPAAGGPDRTRLVRPLSREAQRVRRRAAADRGVRPRPVRAAPSAVAGHRRRSIAPPTSSPCRRTSRGSPTWSARRWPAAGRS